MSRYCYIAVVLNFFCSFPSNDGNAGGKWNFLSLAGGYSSIFHVNQDFETLYRPEKYLEKSWNIALTRFMGRTLIKVYVAHMNIG